MITLATSIVRTPVGDVLLVVHEEAACAIAFTDRTERVTRHLARRFGETRLVAARDPGGIRSLLEAYVGGDLAATDRVRVDLGGTPFQRRVWDALRAVPTATTTSYGELAARLGEPRAVRAVANANAQNPVSIVIPCHRVIGKDGTLTGYAGGLPRKSWLLAHEARHGNISVPKDVRQVECQMP